jgi:hypothetical protein
MPRKPEPIPLEQLLDELADLVVERVVERLDQKHEPAPVSEKWTDRVAAALEAYYQGQLLLPDGNVVGDRSQS